MCGNLAAVKKDIKIIIIQNDRVFPKFPNLSHVSPNQRAFFYEAKPRSACSYYKHSSCPPRTEGCFYSVFNGSVVECAWNWKADRQFVFHTTGVRFRILLDRHDAISRLVVVYSCIPQFHLLFVKLTLFTDIHEIYNLFHLELFVFLLKRKIYVHFLAKWWTCLDEPATASTLGSRLRPKYIDYLTSTKQKCKIVECICEIGLESRAAYQSQRNKKQPKNSLALSDGLSPHELPHKPFREFKVIPAWTVSAHFRP